MPSSTNASRVLVVSALILLFELAVIRYLGTELPVVGFFKNLVLIAAFLGLGAGLNMKTPVRRAMILFGFTALLPVVLVVIAPHVGLLRNYSGFDDEAVLLPATRDVAIWLGICLLCLAFVSAMAPFVFLGRLLGFYFDTFESRLRAYGWNIAGSLLGTLAFSATSWLSVPPAIWFLASGLLFVLLLILDLPRVGRLTAALLTGAMAIPVILSMETSGERVIWTPYYKVTTFPMSYGTGEQTGYGLRVNDTWFQRSFNADFLGRPEEVAEGAGAARNLRFLAPLVLARPERVLVLGSGLGNDTAAALRAGARSVTSVDIDPKIIELSDELHPNVPYSDPRVRVVIDDARHFITSTDEEFDLILFGVLEARALFSQFSNLRLDNFVYTREGIETAFRRLGPNGVLWLNMWIPKPWVLKKFDHLMDEIFDGEYAVFQGTDSSHYSFVACKTCSRDDLRKLADSLDGVTLLDQPPDIPDEVSVPTDDWPYIFFRTRRLPLSYVLLLGLLILMSLVPLRIAYRDLFRVEWGFFFLGAAFLLLEANAVTRIALVAGTTWIVNSLVFSGVLVFILLANWAVASGRVKNTSLLFVGLAATLALSFLFPFSRLLDLSNGLALLVAATIMTLPILFAGMVFSTYLSVAPLPSRALGSNVFGAVVGGLAEYLSMLTGNRAMVLLALAAYAGAWLAFRRR